METQASAGGMTIPASEENGPLSRLPEAIADSLTAEQRNALHAVTAPGRPPINLRFSFAFVKWHVYLAVIGGIERRSPERRVRERVHHPLHTLGNVLFGLGVAVLFLLAAFLAIALQSAILEF